MYIDRFDTFEDESELSEMIKNFQSKSIEYMSQVDEWEKPVKKDIKSLKVWVVIFSFWKSYNLSQLFS